MPKKLQRHRAEHPSFDAEAEWFATLVEFVNSDNPIDADGAARDWERRVRFDLRRAVESLVKSRHYDCLAGRIEVGGTVEPSHDRDIPTVTVDQRRRTAAVTGSLLSISHHYVTLFRLAHAMNTPGGPRLRMCPDCDRRVLLSYRRVGSRVCVPCKQRRYRQRQQKPALLRMRQA